MEPVNVPGPVLVFNALAMRVDPFSTDRSYSPALSVPLTIRTVPLLKLTSLVMVSPVISRTAPEPAKVARLSPVTVTLPVSGSFPSTVAPSAAYTLPFPEVVVGKLRVDPEAATTFPFSVTVASDRLTFPSARIPLAPTTMLVSDSEATATFFRMVPLSVYAPVPSESRVPVNVPSVMVAEVLPLPLTLIVGAVISDPVAMSSAPLASWNMPVPVIEMEESVTVVADAAPFVWTWTPI